MSMERQVVTRARRALELLSRGALYERRPGVRAAVMTDLGTMLRQGVIAPGERLPHVRGGASRLLWPGPRAGEVLSPEEVSAWEAARQVPPERGVVTVAGEQRPVVDGVALGTVPGGDWRLRRGGVAVRQDGKTGRWEA